MRAITSSCLVLPAESARGDQKQLTSLLETSQSVCLRVVREIDRLPDSQRERRTYHTLDAWSSSKLQSFPPGWARLTPTRSGRCRQPPTTSTSTCCRRGVLVVSYSTSTRPCLGPLWRLPWQRLGSVLGPGDELMMLTTSTRTARTPARRFTP